MSWLLVVAFTLILLDSGKALGVIADVIYAAGGFNGAIGLSSVAWRRLVASRALGG